MNPPEHLPPAKQDIVHAQTPRQGASHEIGEHLVATSFSGPIPPPEVLAKYEAACPGAADRIISMAEQEAKHRRSMESLIVAAGNRESQQDYAEARLGQLCALVVTLASISVGCYLGMHGHEISGGIIGIGGIGGVVTTFILGRAGGSTRKDTGSPSVPAQANAGSGSGENRPR